MLERFGVARCCCDEEEPGCSCDAPCVILEFSGVTNDECTECDDINYSTYILLGGECGWGRRQDCACDGHDLSLIVEEFPVSFRRKVTLFVEPGAKFEGYLEAGVECEGTDVELDNVGVTDPEDSQCGWAGASATVTFVKKEDEDICGPNICREGPRCPCVTFAPTSGTIETQGYGPCLDPETDPFGRTCAYPTQFIEQFSICYDPTNYCSGGGFNFMQYTHEEDPLFPPFDDIPVLDCQTYNALYGGQSSSWLDACCRADEWIDYREDPPGPCWNNAVAYASWLRVEYRCDTPGPGFITIEAIWQLTRRDTFIGGQTTVIGFASGSLVVSEELGPGGAIITLNGSVDQVIYVGDADEGPGQACAFNNNSFPLILTLGGGQAPPSATPISMAGVPPLRAPLSSPFAARIPVTGSDVSWTISSPAPSTASARLATVGDFPCTQRGKYLETVKGRGCRRGEKVYECAEFGKCSMRTCGTEIAVCIGCEKRIIP